MQELITISHVWSSLAWHYMVVCDLEALKSPKIRDKTTSVSVAPNHKNHSDDHDLSDAKIISLAFLFTFNVFLLN